MIQVLPDALFIPTITGILWDDRDDHLDRRYFFYAIDQADHRENNYQQLFGYAESVEKTTQTFADTFPQFNQDQAFQNALELTEQVLTEQNVNFIFIDKYEQVIYPTAGVYLNFYDYSRSNGKV